jgi:hypothetical protein
MRRMLEPRFSLRIIRVLRRSPTDLASACGRMDRVSGVLFAYWLRNHLKNTVASFSHEF